MPGRPTLPRHRWTPVEGGGICNRCGVRVTLLPSRWVLYEWPDGFDVELELDPEGRTRVLPCPGEARGMVVAEPIRLMPEWRVA